MWNALLRITGMKFPLIDLHIVNKYVLYIFVWAYYSSLMLRVIRVCRQAEQCSEERECLLSLKT
jgi:hypothetical protein